MSRFEEVLDNIFIGRREGAALYQRIFVVSAYSGMTNLLLEHKKTGEPGVYQRFADAQSEGAWREALEGVRQRMLAKNAELFSSEYELHAANQFINSRIDDASECMHSLQKLCAYGHFQLSEHLMKVREMLASSARPTAPSTRCWRSSSAASTRAWPTSPAGSRKHRCRSRR